jgi:hydroxymethylpyrimidine/phosphomethylpyrimidine kinase
VQDTTNVYRIEPVEVELLEQQARTVLNDLPVAAIKIGLIGHAESAASIAQILREHPDIPTILDPVLAAGGGMEMGDQALLETIRNELLPHITLLTPNSPEARRLSGESKLAQCAAKLLGMGCNNLLITGGHEDEEKLINRLYSDGGEQQSWSWLRFGESYHGSGCTLASAIAALVARGIPLIEAVEQAQEYTWQSISHGTKPGDGQAVPNRFHRE